MNLDIGYTRLLIDECKKQGALRNQCAAILGNVYRETGGVMFPIKETVMPWHNNKKPTDKSVISRLNDAYARGRLGQVKKPYWKDGWFGRGFIQTTHNYNYERAERETGIPFTTDRDLMLDPENSAIVTVRGCLEGWFTGKKMSDYITLQKSDFFNARRVVNGLDAAGEVAKLSAAYDKALKSEGYGVVDVSRIPEPKGKPKVHKSLTQSKEMLLGVTGLIGAVTAFLEKIDGNTAALVLGALALGFMANRLWARFKDER